MSKNEKGRFNFTDSFWYETRIGDGEHMPDRPTFGGVDDVTIIVKNAEELKMTESVGESEREASCSRTLRKRLKNQKGRPKGTGEPIISSAFLNVRFGTQKTNHTRKHLPFKKQTQTWNKFEKRRVTGDELDLNIDRVGQGSAVRVNPSPRQQMAHTVITRFSTENGIPPQIP